MSDDPGGSVEYGLVMPFVVCRTQGGPYDDQSFVAGFQSGQIAATLDLVSDAGVKTIAVPHCVYRPLLPLLDLLAMRYGYQMQSADVTAGEDTETWATVEFHRPDRADPPGSRVADHG